MIDGCAIFRTGERVAPIPRTGFLLQEAVDRLRLVNKEARASGRGGKWSCMSVCAPSHPLTFSRRGAFVYAPSLRVEGRFQPRSAAFSCVMSHLLEGRAMAQSNIS